MRTAGRSSLFLIPMRRKRNYGQDGGGATNPTFTPSSNQSIAGSWIKDSKPRTPSWSFPILNLLRLSWSQARSKRFKDQTLRFSAETLPFVLDLYKELLSHSAHWKRLRFDIGRKIAEDAVDSLGVGKGGSAPPLPRASNCPTPYSDRLSPIGRPCASHQGSARDRPNFCTFRPALERDRGCSPAALRRSRSFHDNVP